MFGAEQYRTDTLQTKEGRRSPMNVRQDQYAALPGQVESLHKGQKCRVIPSHEYSSSSEVRISKVCAVSVLRGFKSPMPVKQSATWSELPLDCFKQEVGLRTLQGHFQDELSHDSTVTLSRYLAQHHQSVIYKSSKWDTMTEWRNSENYNLHTRTRGSETSEQQHPANKLLSDCRTRWCRNLNDIK